MAFEGNFSVVQLSPSTIKLIDTSTGADSNIYTRQIYLYQYNGQTIVPTNNPAGQTYITWAIQDTEITLEDILTTDVALNITVNWLSTAPDPSGSYSKNSAYCFKDYNEEFLLGLVAEVNVAYPNIVNSNQYVNNWEQMRLYVDSAFQIVNEASDVTNAQILLNFANNMRLNQSYYF